MWRPRKLRLYLGVWARVKRRLWRLMLRFIISLRNSSGEFRGDPRGEFLGDPPGEPALDLGMSLRSLVNLWSCAMSSSSDSSELSVHSSLMAVGLSVHLGLAKTGSKCKSSRLHQTSWCHDSFLICSRWSYCLRSSPHVHMLEQILGLSMVSPNASPQTHGTSEHLQPRLLSLLETFSFCAHRDHIDCCARRGKKPSNINVYVLALPPSLLPAHFVYITAKPSLSPTKYGHLIYREVKRDRSPPSCSISCIPPSSRDQGYCSSTSYCAP